MCFYLGYLSRLFYEIHIPLVFNPFKAAFEVVGNYDSNGLYKTKLNKTRIYGAVHSSNSRSNKFWRKERRGMRCLCFTIHATVLLPAKLLTDS